MWVESWCGWKVCDSRSLRLLGWEPEGEGRAPHLSGRVTIFGPSEPLHSAAEGHKDWAFVPNIQDANKQGNGSLECPSIYVSGGESVVHRSVSPRVYFFQLPRASPGINKELRCDLGVQSHPHGPKSQVAASWESNSSSLNGGDNNLRGWMWRRAWSYRA